MYWPGRASLRILSAKVAVERIDQTVWNVISAIFSSFTRSGRFSVPSQIHFLLGLPNPATFFGCFKNRKHHSVIYEMPIGQRLAHYYGWI